MRSFLIFFSLILTSGAAMAQQSPDKKMMDRLDTGAYTGPYFYNTDPLLILQDGQEAYKLDKSVILDEINPDWIDSMDVLKGAQAIEKYGKEGKDGVVIISFKKDVEEAALYLKNLKKSKK